MLRRLAAGIFQRPSTNRNSIHTSVVLQGSLQEHEYHRAADQCLDTLVEDLEEYFESVGLSDVDIQYSQGVVTIQMGSKGTYVINKQTPNKQIWLSSPISGPFRYDYEGGEWIYQRDLHSMKRKLTTELVTLFHKEPTFH